MGWSERKAMSDEWASRVIEKIKNRGWQVVPMGAEHVVPEVQQILSSMEDPDPTAAFVRYLPDGFAVHELEEKAFFFDAKAGKSIEKDAYNNYLAFKGEDRIVYVVIEFSGNAYWVPVEHIAFFDSHEVVMQFSERLRMPIDNEGWLAPRLWPTRKYRRWKSNNPQASGTPFKYFDFDKMRSFISGYEQTTLRC